MRSSAAEAAVDAGAGDLGGAAGVRGRGAAAGCVQGGGCLITYISSGIVLCTK
jgi:hypothetical protein